MKKEKNSAERCTLSSKWLPPFSLFCSFADFTLPLYLLSPWPLDTCHPLTQEPEGGLMRWWRWLKLYSRFHFQRNTSHCHQILAKRPVKGVKTGNDVDNYSRQCWKDRVTSREIEFGEALTLSKRGAMSDVALVPMFLRDGVKMVQQWWFIFQESKPPGSHSLKPGPQHQNVRAFHEHLLPKNSGSPEIATRDTPFPILPFWFIPR